MEAQAKEHQAKMEAQAREHQARQQEPAPTTPAPAGMTLTEDARQRIYEEEKAKRETPQGAIANPPVARPRTTLQSLGLFLGIPLAFIVLLLIGIAHMVDRRDAQQAPLKAAQRIEAALRADREAGQRIEAEHQRLKKEAACRKSLDCWGPEHRIAAIIKCQEGIEKLAKYQFEWTDGWLEPKLTHSQWLNPERGIVRYSGDKIKLQNGFGAWQPHIYECDYDTVRDAALDVRVHPGRLP